LFEDGRKECENGFGAECRIPHRMEIVGAL
jgi:hypothetical protein